MLVVLRVGCFSVVPANGACGKVRRTRTEYKVLSWRPRAESDRHNRISQNPMLRAASWSTAALCAKALTSPLESVGGSVPVIPPTPMTRGRERLTPEYPSTP